MSDVVISAEALSKRYRIRHRRGQHYGLRHALQDAAAWPLRWLRARPSAEPGRPANEDFWALKDVSFDVRRGEVLGVIGRNGAGKSTLLKILSRITEPTSGRARIRGRVASLLEVGTGFHQELTGRENVFLGGAILGMTRQEVRARFDEIVAFAEVEPFIDTPVKHYSSGMYLRLAFAVAAHLEPEILIVDEVLAVGDAEFQSKCLGKIGAVAGRDGRTVLFVSHNLAAVQTLCDEVLHLRDGQLIGKGSAEEQIWSYTRQLHQQRDSALAGRRQLSPDVSVDSLTFSPNPVRSGTELAFSIQLSSTQSVALRDLSLEVYSVIGAKIANVDLRGSSRGYGLGAGRSLRLEGRVRQLCLVEGEYSVGIYIRCGALVGHFGDLCHLAVLKAQRWDTLIPYAVRDRGYVELDYEFSLAPGARQVLPVGVAE